MVSTQIKNAFVSIGEVHSTLLPASLVLKLGIGMQHIRYFVQSTSHNQIVFFGEYTLHHVDNVNELCHRLEKIFEKDDILQLAFSKSFIGIDGAYNLVPAAFSFASNNGPDQFNQPIQHLGLNMVFDADEALINKIRGLFSNPEIVHIDSSLINSLPGFLENEQQKLFVNVEQNHFDVLFFNEQGGLVLMNRYGFKTQTDFIYFLLLCCDQLNIDREKTELVLSGKVDIESKIYDVCYRYFRFISFIRTPENVHFSRAFDIFPKHLHINLYNLGS